MPSKTSASNLSAEQLSRAVGTMLGLASGDALGAGYEFKARVPYTQPIEMCGGGGWDPGEWTDDTDMAICIAQVAASGQDLLTKVAQDQIVRKWIYWADQAKDVGLQTSSVLSAAGPNADSESARRAAYEEHEYSGRSAGNGSLMRTAPVALAFLHDADSLNKAARQISDLTHFESDAGDACVLWCQAIRHAVLHGKLPNFYDLVKYLPTEHQRKWQQRISEAYEYESFQFEKNGWVVSAFQAALSAIVHAGTPAEIPELGLSKNQHLQIAIERAVRCGGDTDTVGAIAGSLVGALWGASAIPNAWAEKLHGFPDYSADDLVRLALQITSCRTVGKIQQIVLDCPAIESWSPFALTKGVETSSLFDTKSLKNFQMLELTDGCTSAILNTDFGTLRRKGGSWTLSEINQSEVQVITREIKVTGESLVEIHKQIAKWDEFEFSQKPED